MAKQHKSPEQIAEDRVEAARRSRTTFLDLSRLGLTRLPDALAKLTALQTLDVHSNQLANVPDSLAELTALQTLDLRNNRLTTLPDALAKLTALQALNLGNNRLTALPDALTKLTALRALNLDGNLLTTLPLSLAKLTDLEAIDLRNNQLTTLPDSLAKLTDLKGFFLHGNPALSLPPEVLGPTWSELGSGNPPTSPASILAYYFANRRLPTRPLNEAKLLFVGEGKVGKTSLVNFLLRNQPCQGDEQMTQGIHIDHYHIDGKRPNEQIQLNVWDFGGQEIMHATHQFFLTKRSLYLLVLDARHTERQNRLEYWLRLVQSFAADSPIIVVLNQTDDGNLTLDRTGLLKKYAPNLKAFIETSCKTGRGIPELRQLIQHEIHDLEQVDTKLPLPWFTLKQALEKCQAQGDPHMSWPAYQTLCQEHNISKDVDQQSLAQFLHDLGVVLSFRDDRRLADTNILSPHWVTAGVYSIITHKHLADSGILARDRLPSILDQKLYPPDKQQFIIDMMRKFELCFEFDDSTGDRWLIPGLLDKEQPAIAWPDTIMARSGTPGCTPPSTGLGHDPSSTTRPLPATVPANIVRFEYRYAVLPDSVISRFIVRNHQYLSKTCPIYWRTGVVLEIDGTQALIIADPEDRRISISVQGPNSALCRSALTVVRYDLDRIHASVPRIDAIGKVPLPDRPDIAVSYSHLLQLEARGKHDFLPEGADRDYTVAEVLDGIADPAHRRSDRQHLFPEYTQRRKETDMSPKHIFLSYCHDNAAEVKQLHDDLEKAGESVWWDQDLLPGQDFKQEIRRAMKNAYAVILCLSNDLSARPRSGLYPELSDAIAAYRQHAPGSIFLIPIRLSACPIPDIEIDDTRTLDRLQYIDLFPPTNRPAALQTLLTALRQSPTHP